MTDFAAIDLGASSGRVVCGRLADGARWRSRSATGSRTGPCGCRTGCAGTCCTSSRRRVGALRGRSLAGVGVDTWGVDYALLDSAAPRPRSPLPLPRFAHRGASGVGGYERHRHPGHADQHRLPVARRRSRRAEAPAIALVPDLLAYWLSGELANERTNASTTGLLDARTGEWAHELIERLGLPARPFGALVEPGRSSAACSRTTRSTHPSSPSPRTTPPPPTWPRRCATSTPPCSRPAPGRCSGSSCGGPVFSDPALTNERGVDGTIRLLKNVMGLWLEQECARVWDADFPSLQAAAREATRRGPDVRRRRRALPARRRHAGADRGGACGRAS